MSSSMTHTIFVYGTLKRRFPNHGLMAGAAFLGEARTVEAFPMVVQGKSFAPVMMPEPGLGHRIVGELWQVGDAKLVELDQLESTHLPSGYIRQMIDVEAKAGGKVSAAWVYFKPRERVTIIHSDPHADYQDRRYADVSDCRN